MKKCIIRIDWRCHQVCDQCRHRLCCVDCQHGNESDRSIDWWFWYLGSYGHAPPAMITVIVQQVMQCSVFWYVMNDQNVYSMCLSCGSVTIYLSVCVCVCSQTPSGALHLISRGRSVTSLLQSFPSTLRLSVTALCAFARSVDRSVGRSVVRSQCGECVGALHIAIRWLRRTLTALSSSPPIWFILCFCNWAGVAVNGRRGTDVQPCSEVYLSEWYDQCLRAEAAVDCDRYRLAQTSMTT